MPSVTGNTIGDYLVEARIGSGGMGEVYAARHVVTGAAVAIKMLRPEASDKDRLRFQREGEAQAAVDRHPNVVRIHTAGEWEGIPYLVMDLAHGNSLEERLERSGPLPVREAARLARDLARGVAHVHSHGVLHRDLKPGNVLFDERGAPKLVDFGIAMVEGSSLTRTGAIIGTPLYMSPEQALGARDRIGATTDVYGLGGLLYAMLTGEPPFTGTNAVVVLHAVTTVAPVPPSQLRADIDARLEALVLRCLEKEPKDRPASAAALADALDAWLSAGPLGPSGVRWAASAAVAIVLFVTGVVAWDVVSSDHPAPESPPPAEPQPIAPTEPTKADPRQRVAGQPLRQIVENRVGTVSLHSAFVDSEVVVTLLDRELIRWRLPSSGGGQLEELFRQRVPRAFMEGRVVVCATKTAIVLGGRSAGLAWVAPNGSVIRDPRVRVVDAMILTHDRQRVFVADRQRYAIQRYGLASTKPVPPAYGVRELVVALAVSPDGSRLAILSGDKAAGLDSSKNSKRGVDGKRLSVFDVSTGVRIYELDHGTLGRCLSYSPDGMSILVGTAVGEIRVVDGQTGAHVRNIEDPGLRDTPFYRALAQPGSMRGIVFSRDGRRMFSVTRGSLESERVLKAWEGERPVQALRLRHEVSRLDRSPDGRRLLVSSHDGILQVWDIE